MYKTLSDQFVAASSSKLVSEACLYRGSCTRAKLLVIRDKYEAQPGESFTDKYLSANVGKRHSAELHSQRSTVLLHHLKRRTLGQGKFKMKVQALSSRERKAVGLFEFSRNEVMRYDSFIPLHQMWNEYVEQLINIDTLNEENLATRSECLLKADYHGCEMVVRRSRCPSYIGTRGIILQETQNTFRIITRTNSVKAIPKSGTTFTFKVGKYYFNLHGSQFAIRVADRAKRKYKHKPTLA